LGSSQRCRAEGASSTTVSSRLRLAANEGIRVSNIEDDAPTFEAFFEAEVLTLFRRMCLVTGDRHEAEEIVQDAFLALFERWDRVRDLEDPVGYLYRSAFNRWKKRSRRAARQLRTTIGMLPSADAFDSVDDRELIDRGLAQLTPRQRAAVVLTDVLGYTSGEAASMLGVRDVTVRALASHGRATMRQVLDADDE
jgi:RNA polymerase sigma factor (sigma-70 family)